MRSGPNVIGFWTRFVVTTTRLSQRERPLSSVSPSGVSSSDDEEEEDESSQFSDSSSSLASSSSSSESESESLEL